MPLRKYPTIEPADQEQRGLNRVDPEVHQVAFEPHVERVAENVAGIFVIRFGAGRFAILDEQPTDVAPEPAHLRRMRIGLMVGVLVMQPMDDNPPGGRLLQIADAQNGQAMFEPQRALETAMREQPMVAGADAHRTEDEISHRQPDDAPPTEDVRQKRQRNQQMKQRDADDVRPNDAALGIDHLRPRQRSFGNCLPPAKRASRRVWLVIVREIARRRSAMSARFRVSVSMIGIQNPHRIIEASTVEGEAN